MSKYKETSEIMSNYSSDRVDVVVFFDSIGGIISNKKVKNRTTAKVTFIRLKRSKEASPRKEAMVLNLVI